ncbi:MAG: ribosome-associated ATPase/putative transporter RbbA [Hyphomicrobium sp.]|uniref:ribosome-associated ATPase/putative transporter RbbA n=1 Tax=Hyphomicrobium sp. TaxID=82 RepID=UPI0013222B86|nr:ribosome-associated ATPase/putative transporter RbbA [Hyphomicrobium sp.]KAB2943216.1 MAG: ribosome-associated ATPase/putative transporter RbbA [Hyphomicrobium sp.]MBZ0210143.1 ribosome-associated ATPase/putative transporter RbbA [Hyphomicrobium sp.]
MRADLNAAAELRSVTHRYGRAIALDDVSVIIPAGRMVGLIGPDGVGKSTMQALIAGVRQIQSGRVIALGGDMGNARHRSDVCARIAYMPQGLGRNLYPTLSVYENVDFFGRLFAQEEEERRWRINELLRSTELEAFADRAAGKLSGGMKQKLALCCALIHDPDLLVLDEPTTGVDPLSRKRFWELIERIRERRDGMSVLTATAYMEEAEQFQSLIAMDDGRVVATGSAAELKNMTGCDTLEAAFIELLPEPKRLGHKKLTFVPRVRRDGAPAIEAQDLTKRFGSFTAVDRVSIRIEQGEIFGFLGSNGCGKTTTMKMLTGLLQPSAGSARLFGRPVDARDLETRKRVGYMSQSFSLYNELTVLQNLDLHARLFRVPADRVGARVEEMLQRFGLAAVADSMPQALSLGMRQRLQLAVAVIHSPEMLILDEPTSGVDPVARDNFWELLVELSRKDGVTIFISTHFVNEAERCDRVSLMHAGRILAIGEPDELRRARGAATLSDAFIDYLEAADGKESSIAIAGAGDFAAPDAQKVGSYRRWLSPARIWAFARREALELVRDPIRIAFALLGPVVLLLAMAYGISFDLENVRYAVLDRDQSQESAILGESFSSSRYFEERAPLRSEGDVDVRLRSGDIKVAIGVPPEFGRDLLRERTPEVGVWLDGSDTFRAETARGYVQGVINTYLQDLSRRETGAVPELSPAEIETRFRYNQAFLSIYAISPGVLMMLIIMFCTMLTALGIVREKELGSITNLYAAPVSKLEFLLGKQMPYIGIGLVSFVMLVLIIVSAFRVPMTGSFLALASGALLFAGAATAFGLVISTFVRSQIAAIFGSAIIVSIPTVNFSGMMYPVSTLEGGARVIGELFPALYFQRISTGVFNKGLGLAELYKNHLVLALFFIVFLAAATLLLRKQEA